MKELYLSTLLGDFDVELTNDERNEWRKYCETTQEYRQFMDAHTAREAEALALSGGGSQGDKAAYREADKEYHKTLDAMFPIAKRWWSENVNNFRKTEERLKNLIPQLRSGKGKIGYKLLEEMSLKEVLSLVGPGQASEDTMEFMKDDIVEPAGLVNES